MRPRALRLPVLALALAAAGCSDVFGIPAEGKVGCPAPCSLTVSGRTVRAESTASPPLALSNVTVRLTSVPSAQNMTSAVDGSYSFTGLPPDTALEFDLSVPQSDPNPQSALHTRYRAGKVTADTMLDLPVVQFRWLAQVAWQCGIFPTLNDALFEPGTMNVNSYFVTRTTIVGEVLMSDGSPAELDRADISVVLNDYTNYQKNPADTMNVTTVCFLEPQPDLGEYKGVNADHSSSGRFVMFRARNDLGTGTGTGEVRIPGFPTAALNVSSGSVGLARIQLGDGEPLPSRVRTFERDVYHYFAENQCTTCHKPGGIGYTRSPVRVGSDGKSYPADWSESVEDVYNALTMPTMAGCDQGTPARVCLAKPEASLLYVNPAGLAEHAGAVLTSDNPMLPAVLQWIRDGAKLR